jgi:hypothetical protein
MRILFSKHLFTVYFFCHKEQSIYQISKMVSSLIIDPSMILATYILTYYGYSFMLVFGTIGNFLNIVLFLRKKLRTTSCNNCK